MTMMVIRHTHSHTRSCYFLLGHLIERTGCLNNLGHVTQFDCLDPSLFDDLTSWFVQY